MNCTQIYTGDDLPHLYNMASQLVWQQPENAKQEEHLDVFLVSSVKALLCRWRAQGLNLGRADLAQQVRAHPTEMHLTSCSWEKGDTELLLLSAMLFLCPKPP